MWPYLIVASVLAFPCALLVLWGLQRAGVQWTYRLGFPVGEFEMPDDLNHLDGPTEWVKVKRRGRSFLVSEQLNWRTNPMQSFWTAGLPDKLVATAERVDDRSRLVVRTDLQTSMMWVFPVVLSAMFVWAIATRMPGVRETSDLLFSVGFVAVLLVGLRFFVRRARRRAAALADRLGFPTVPSARGYAPPSH